MRRLPLFLAMALVVAALVPAGFAAIEPLEWDAAVAAAQQVDPTIEAPPSDSTVVSAVGGGQPAAVDASFPTFAFSALEGPTGLHGRMTMNFGSGNAMSAEVMCMSTVTVDGVGLAMIAGALDADDVVTPGHTFLVFHVTDGGPGGPDAWHGVTSPVGACGTPAGSTAPITGAIAINAS